MEFMNKYGETIILEGGVLTLPPSKIMDDGCNRPPAFTRGGDTFDHMFGDVTEIHFSEGTEELGNLFFNGTANPVTVYIPRSVKRITGPFSRDLDVKQFVFAEGGGPEQIEYVGPGVFNHCNNVLLFKHLPIPDAYAWGSEIEKLNIAFKDTTIPAFVGNNAFEGCVFLREVRFATHIDHIYDAAFKSCENLEKVIFDEDVTKIQDDAFDECGTLTFWCHRGSYAELWALKHKHHVKYFREPKEEKSNPDWIRRAFMMFNGQFGDEATATGNER